MATDTANDFGQWLPNYPLFYYWNWAMAAFSEFVSAYIIIHTTQKLLNDNRCFMITRMISTQGLNNPQNCICMIIFKLQTVYCSSCHSNSLVYRQNWNRNSLSCWSNSLKTNISFWTWYWLKTFCSMQACDVHWSIPNTTNVKLVSRLHLKHTSLIHTPLENSNTLG